jgi:hypothetical protein
VRLTLPLEGVVKYQNHLYISHNKSVELPVLLLDQPGNEIYIESSRETIPIRFSGTSDFKERVTLDSSCSGFGISVSKITMPTAWATVSCKPVHFGDAQGETMKLELEILWQGYSEINPIIANSSAKLVDPILVPLTLDSTSSETSIQRGVDTFTIKSFIPARFRHLSVSAGIGPYVHNDVIRPFFTVYAGYYASEAIKLAAFSAIPIGDSPHLDQGLYLITEQARGLNDRLTINLLLGAHFLEFDSGNKSYFTFSAPQGIEMSFKDFLAKKNNITLGSFYYPDINGTSYVNIWFRYGWSSGFLELNYIRWKEQTDTSSYSAKSFGISYGLPLFKAL